MSHKFTKNHICMVCRKRDAKHEYIIQNRGYGSMFDMLKVHWFVCNECNRVEFRRWAGARPRLLTSDSYYKEYPYEDKVIEYISNLPAQSQNELWNDSGIDN